MNLDDAEKTLADPDDDPELMQMHMTLLQRAAGTLVQSKNNCKLQSLWNSHRSKAKEIKNKRRIIQAKLNHSEFLMKKISLVQKSNRELDKLLMRSPETISLTLGKVEYLYLAWDQLVQAFCGLLTSIMNDKRDTQTAIAFLYPLIAIDPIFENLIKAVYDSAQGSSTATTISDEEPPPSVPTKVKDPEFSPFEKALNESIKYHEGVVLKQRLLRAAKQHIRGLKSKT